MPAVDDTDDQLLQRFVEAFTLLDDTVYTHAAPPLDAFSAGLDPDDWDVIRWRPASWQTPSSALAAIRFAGPLPALFEMLALSYRWPEVDLGVCRLLSHEPAAGLEKLAASMLSDPVMDHTLVSARLVRFALAPDNYDPICFDLNRFKDHDCPIVRLNHETILMYDSVGTCLTIFKSFRELVLAVIRSAA